MELNVARIHTAIAAAVPERECLVFRDRRLSWADVADRSSRLASTLVAHGLGASPTLPTDPWGSNQSHVALLAHNGNEYLEAMLGSYKARCVPVNVNYRYTATELEYLLTDSASEALVFQGRFAGIVDEVRARLPRLRLLLQVDDGTGHEVLDGALDYEAALAGADPQLDAALVDAWSPDDRYLCYTGGTTGRPKGVMWRQGDFLVSALGVGRRDGGEYGSIDEIVADAADSTLRALPAPPLMHGAAHWNALSCWIAGGTVVIQDEPGRLDAADIWHTVERERATSLLVVGDPFARPLADELERTAYDVGSLRHVLSGGAVFSPHLKRRVLDLLAARGATDVRIVDVLGSSESGRQGVSSRASGDADGSARFAASTTAVVLDETRTRRLGPGEGIGWLAQSGRVPLAYLGDRAKSEATFVTIDGVRHAVAGDRARLDDRGRIELLGRDSVCINTGGEKVFAEEVETAVKRHPAVYDAVVCGRPSPRWGSEVVVIASSVDGAELDLESLRDTCRAELADFKLPKALVVVDEVVRSPSGKADYRWAEATAQAAS